MAALKNSDHPHILLATDRSPEAQEHLAFATRLGNKLGARLILYHALPPKSLVINAPLGENRADAGLTMEEARLLLQETASTLVSDRPVHVEVDEEPDATHAILAAADRLKADLIVLPTHGRSGVSRAVLGSTAEQVLRRATKPVLLLTDHMLKREAQTVDADGPMIIATDLSEESVDAHLPTVALAQRLGLPVHLLSIVTEIVPPPLGGGAPVAAKPMDEKPAIEARTKRLRELALALGSKAEISVEAQVAHDPVAVLVQRADELRAPLLVMTTHGRRGILRMLQGSVAEQVVRRATTPVLVMPLSKQ